MDRDLSALTNIEKLMGPVEKNRLNNTDHFISEKIAMFMPVSGACDFAVGAVHAHPSYQFVLPFNDRVSFQIGSREVLTEPTKLLALSPQIAHKEIIADRFPRYVAIFIEKDFFEKQISFYPFQETPHFGGQFLPIPQNFLMMVKEFMLEVRQPLPGGEQVLLGLSLRICHSILRSMLHLGVKNNPLTHRLEVDKTIQFMHANLDRKISIEELAEIAHMSPSHYARIFKKETGQSSISYLNQIRLEQVKRLLLEGTKSITDIALACGFSSAAYLSASFYQKYKLSPKEYQNLMKK